MGVTACPACGATVQTADDIQTGELVVLEVNTDPSSDAPRYRIVSTGPRLQVERVPDGWAGDFYPDHKFDCKDFGNGLPR